MISHVSRPEYRPLGYIVHRVHLVLRAEATAALEPIGVTLNEFVLMVMLADSPGQSSAELARGIGLTPQAANLILKELETMGTVTRPPHAPSGRARPAKLTAAGAARLRRAEKAVRQSDERLLSRLSRNRADELRRLLTELGSAHADTN